MDWIEEGLCGWINGGTAWFIQTAFYFYNLFVKGAYNMLITHPDAWLGGAGWNVAKTANGIFVGIGTSLVAVFFLISFCAESMNPRNDLRLENILRMMLKLSLAEWFVSNSFELVTSLFGLIDSFSGGMGSLEIVYSSIQDRISSIHNFGGAVGCFLMACIFSLGFIASGILIFYTAFIRLFKVLCLLPYGAIANATLVGGYEVRRTAASYWRYAASIILEAVTMILALKLCAVLCSNQSHIDLFQSLTNTGLSDTSYVIGYLLQSLFIALACVGSVRGASALTQRVLGI